jgi:hypothetical protein
MEAERSRRGRTARQRGNAYERSVAERVFGKRVGQYGGKADVESDWLALQCKNGMSYPERLDGWLRAIPVRADRLRGVVVADSPGAGTKRRELIVFDLTEWLQWHGPDGGDGTNG